MASSATRAKAEIVVPSLHDGIDIECRISFEEKAFEQTELKGAILSHPYAPLGGCFDNPVLELLSDELLDDGYVVCLFNFRGAGKSGGKTSWTGHPETEDFISIIGFFVHYLASVSEKQESKSKAKPLTLIVGGYSYGSMICSKLPDPPTILKTFSDQSTERHAEILRKVSELAGVSVAAQYPPKDITWEMLLIAPLLPPLTVALAIPTFGRDTVSGGQDVSNVTKYKTLAIFGDQDSFTSGPRLTKWGEKMQKEESSKFEFVKVAGAGHFWREPGVTDKLMDAFRNWMRS